MRIMRAKMLRFDRNLFIQSVHHFSAALTIKFMLRLLQDWLFEPLYQTAHITQTAGALWVSQITRTLSCIYPGIDVVYKGITVCW